MRVCESRFCNHTVEAPAVFCLRHWAMLPFELQERIGDAYKAPEHRGMQPNPAWAVAVTQAIGFLAARTA